MLVSSLLLRSQRADESSWELFRSTFDVHHQIWYRNATTSIFRFLKIGNFQDYLENPLKMWNLKKFKTVQKLSRSNSETIYKLLVLRKTISSYPHIPWYSRLSWFQRSEMIFLPEHPTIPYESSCLLVLQCDHWLKKKFVISLENFLLLQDC